MYDCLAAKGSFVTDDFIDMGANARMEIGATLFGIEARAAQLY